MHSVYSTTTAMCRRCVYTDVKYWQAVALSDGTRQHATCLLLIHTFLSKRSLFLPRDGRPFPLSKSNSTFFFAQAKRKKGNLNLCHCSLPLPQLFYHPPPVCLRCEREEQEVAKHPFPSTFFLPSSLPLVRTRETHLPQLLSGVVYSACFARRAGGRD